MVRSYTDEPVDPRVVDRALINATRAPSAGFSQGWGFLVLDTPGDVRRYWAATADVDHPDRWLRGMMRAPVVVLPCSSKQAYLDRYAEWWAYVDAHVRDLERGSWHHELDPSNRPAATVWPGKPDLYHAVQATLLPRLPLAPGLAAATALSARA